MNDLLSLIRNCCVIGATKVEKPNRDSHYHIYFGNFRWQNSCNDDLVPDKYLKELVSVVHLPLEAIKYALINREKPKLEPKIH